MLMLLTLNSMKNVPILGIQTGRRLGLISDPIINPDNLQIAAWYVTGKMVGFSPAVIFSEDIHELGHLGAIIDSASSILSLDNLVRLQEILDSNFSLLNLPVINTDGQKLGKVDDFNFDSDYFLVKQIIVKPKLTQRLKISHFIINRNQIIDVDNKKIIVDSGIKKVIAPKKTSRKVSKMKSTKPKAPRTSTAPMPETKQL